MQTALERIWILEDEKNCHFVYEEILQSKFALTIFSTSSGFREAIKYPPRAMPRLIIADLRLSDGSFLEFLGQQQEPLFAPFMVVSSAQDLDILRNCFRFGARDFLTKPFSAPELLVKVERLLTMEPAIGRQLRLDHRGMRVSNEIGLSMPLTQREFQILDLLEKAPEKQLTRTEIIQSIWKDNDMSSKNFDVHLVHLRRKLRDVGYQIVMTKPGTYRLSPHEESC